MVKSGNYPPQGKVTDTETQAMSFRACTEQINQIIGSITPEYPVEIIVDTQIMKMIKAWTNDGAITLTCSGPDEKFTFTTAPYK
ncbi:MAG: hypothetical protein IPK65_11645 [Gammaproteobacteria bacterium]|nr:hypothetical protein [Gammaproteobacteria bacterium]